MNAERASPVWRLTRHQGFDERSARRFLCQVTAALRNSRGNLGCGEILDESKILRRNGSSGRHMTKIQLIVRNV